MAVFFGGMPIDKDKKTLKENCPHIVVATPGRCLGLIRSKALNLKGVKHFVLDECDKMLDALGMTHSCITHYDVIFVDMRRDVQEIFRQTPHEKQVMMFSATLSKDTRGICKKFMTDVNMTRHDIKSHLTSCHMTFPKKISLEVSKLEHSFPLVPAPYPNSRVF